MQTDVSCFPAKYCIQIGDAYARVFAHACALKRWKGDGGRGEESRADVLRLESISSDVTQTRSDSRGGRERGVADRGSES